MLEFILQLALASGALAQNTSSYIETLPPAPHQSSLTCRDDNWASSNITSVEGAKIHRKLAPYVESLLEVARNEGAPLQITVSYRSCALQHQLRALNCGLGDFNLYQKPSEQCSPPTEPAGKSMHNEGLAIDFNCQGYSLIEHSPCYSWLKKHADRYHLKEHALEPWHWSTTGV
jgi:LAS superfamily LD-carboxypeptidase LdcB